jgi:hypothetical protein
MRVFAFIVGGSGMGRSEGIYATHQTN